MNYLAIEKDSIENGPGIRIAVFFAGCLPNKCKEGNCPGCHNPDAQKFTSGKKYTTEIEDYILKLCDNDYIAGITILGGEPYDQEEGILIRLLRAFRERNPNKDVWLYTGYSFKDIRNRALSKYIDVAVVGPFILAKRDISDANRWRGSTNQRVIDMRASLTADRPIFLSNIPNND